MTHQVADTVLFEGTSYLNWDTPLDGYFIERGLMTRIVEEGARHPACRRGYVARWVVVDGLLRLAELERHQQPGSLFRRVFGKAAGRPLAALWFSGTLRLFEADRPQPGRWLELDVSAGRVCAVRRMLREGWETA
jgi:hypothetical protein